MSNRIGLLIAGLLAVLIVLVGGIYYFEKQGDWAAASAVQQRQQCLDDAGSLAMRLLKRDRPWLEPEDILRGRVTICFVNDQLTAEEVKNLL